MDCEIPDTLDTIMSVYRRQQRPAQQAVTDCVTTWKPELLLTVTHDVGHVYFLGFSEIILESYVK